MWEFIRALVANVVADLVAGAVLGVLFACFVDRQLRLRERAQQEREERRERIDRARKYLGLLRSEVEGVAKWIPGQVEKVRSTEWGMAVPIATPVWDVVQQSGDLVPLVNPELLERTAFFYAEVAYARHILDFLQLSWLAPEESVEAIKQKRREMRDAVAGTLELAKDSAKEMLKSLEEEIKVLEARMEDLDSR